MNLSIKSLWIIDCSYLVCLVAPHVQFKMYICWHPNDSVIDLYLVAPQGANIILDSEGHLTTISGV